MSNNESNPVKELLDKFFDNASPEEIKELKSLLDKKKNSRGLGGGGLNTDRIASGMAKDLQKRMGLTTDQINRTARDAVRTMILQYNPHIPEREIQVLLDQWVPDPKNKKRLPADMLHTMILQFAAYGTGDLTEEDLAGYPEGWVKKYWESFPESIQKLISAYLKGLIGKSKFLESVEMELKKL